MISLGSRYSLGMFTLEVKTDRQSLDETEKLRTVSLPAPAINKLMVGGCEIYDIYHFTFRQLALFQLAKNQKKFTVYNCNGNLKKKTRNVSETSMPPMVQNSCLSSL